MTIVDDVLALLGIKPKRSGVIIPGFPNARQACFADECPNPAETARLLAAFVNAWAAEFGESPRRVHGVTITWRRLADMRPGVLGSTTGRQITCAWWPGHSVVHSALAHELVHVALGGGTHEDPVRWHEPYASIVAAAKRDA